MLADPFVSRRFPILSPSRPGLEGLGGPAALGGGTGAIANPRKTGNAAHILIGYRLVGWGKVKSGLGRASPDPVRYLPNQMHLPE
jgi:hypothetical protein